MKSQKWISALRRIALCEFALVEACQDAAANTEGVARAFLVSQAGAAQVHLFDVDNILRTVGAEPVALHRRIRRALLKSGPLPRVMEQLHRAYDHILSLNDVPAGLQQILRANAAEHAQLTLT